MTKAEALHAFMSGFTWTAYPNQATIGADGKDPAFPYLVYEQNIGSIDDGPIAIVINLWDYSRQSSDRLKQDAGDIRENRAGRHISPVR